MIDQLPGFLPPGRKRHVFKVGILRILRRLALFFISLNSRGASAGHAVTHCAGFIVTLFRRRGAHRGRSGTRRSPEHHAPFDEVPDPLDGYRAL